MLRITGMVERWPVDGSFVIARGAKDYVDILLVAIGCDGEVGQGEGTAIYYRGETAESCLAQVEAACSNLEALSPKDARLALPEILPAGAARNAADCALWDLEAKLAGKPLWEHAGLSKPAAALTTAYTISLDDADKMQAAAARAATQGYDLLKLKLTGEGDEARVDAVHRGAPDARLIVDANESWISADIAPRAADLKELGVEMIEQPLPDGKDAALADVNAVLPIYADESCHSATDIPRLAGLYDGVNIKLDKAGGLTQAIEIYNAARAHNMGVMLGCMLSTSLGIAPAFLLAQQADFVDLDGPALLAEDRANCFTFRQGKIASV